MTSVGFEPMPMKTTALTSRLRPLGHDVLLTTIRHVPNYIPYKLNTSNHNYIHPHDTLFYHLYLLHNMTYSYITLTSISWYRWQKSLPFPILSVNSIAVYPCHSFIMGMLGNLSCYSHTYLSRSLWSVHRDFMLFLSSIIALLSILTNRYITTNSTQLILHLIMLSLH